MKKALLTLTALSMSMAISACGMNHNQGNPPYGEWRGSDERTDHMAEGFFHRLDKNGDGLVTKSEYKQYTNRWFADADTNHDGKLTVDEVKAKFRKDKEDMKKHHHHHPRSDDAAVNGENAPPPPPFQPRPQ